MGPVNSVNCERWRDVMAGRSFGAVAPAEAAGLAAHLEGCGECRDVAREMSDTIAMLRYASSDAAAATLSVASLSAGLVERVLGDLRRGAARERFRRRSRALVAAATLVAAASLVLVGVFGARTQPLGETTWNLAGSTVHRASVTLTAEPWGTSVQLRESGLAGGAYTVSMKTTSGAWWTTGSYRGVAGASVEATMACAVALREIAGVRVTNSSGVTVLATASTTSTAYSH